MLSDKLKTQASCADDFDTDYETSPISLDGQVNPKWVAQFEEE